MSSGQVLCLSSGTYGSTSNDFVYYAAGVTITSAPGATATIVGDQRIEAANVTEEYLNVDNSNNLDGTPSESGCPAPVSVALELDGDNDTLQYDNIYEATASLRGNLIGVGFQEEGNGVDYTHPSGVIIRHDKLSDAGQCAQQDHLIYEAEGQGAQIYDNWFWDDPHGFCIQLYPDAEDASVYGNVFDSCGAGAIVGDGGGSTVQNNVALNGVTISGDTSGTGCAFAPFGTSSGATGGNDSIVDNASWNNSNGIFCGSASTVTASGNVALSNDPFNGDATHDYTLNAYGESSVGSYGLWNGQGSPSPDPAP